MMHNQEMTMFASNKSSKQQLEMFVNEETKITIDASVSLSAPQHIIAILDPGHAGCSDEPHLAGAKQQSSGVENNAGLSVGTVVDGRKSSDGKDVHGMQELIWALKKDESIGVEIRYSVTKNINVAWRTTYVNQVLYVDIPDGSLPAKSAFVAFLEYAEDVLLCREVVLCFPKDRADRASLIRTFSFLGFRTIPPNCPTLFAPDESKIYMGSKL